MSTTQTRRGVPPLRNLQAVMDNKAMTRAQLTRRSGLSPPTIRRALEGRAGVSASTVRQIAKVLSVPQEALYTKLTPEELAHQARYPAITAGREYTYPEASPWDGERAAERNGNSSEPVADGEGEHESLRETLRRMEARLEAIEEAVLELASRPIAQFDVSLMERGKEGGKHG